MPGYKPTIAVPFAVNSLVTTAQLFWILKGAKFYYTARLVPCFIGSGIILAILPFAA